jgi:hypothetical protein
MLALARTAFLAVSIFGAAVAPANAQSDQRNTSAAADNEASAMGNCFDRATGLSRSATDRVPGSGSSAPKAEGAPGFTGATSSGPSAAHEPGSSGRAGSASSGSDPAGSRPSTLPDC